MKTIFTRSEMSKLEGCFTDQQVDQLYAGRESMTLIEVLESKIPLKDKVYFLFGNCELTLQQKQQLSYELAVIVAPIYNEKYPNDSRINGCIEAVRSFNAGEITKNELESFAYAAAYAAYTAAACYDAACYDASASAAAAAYTAYASYSAATFYSYSAAASAADAAKDGIKYTKKILNKIKEFVKNNEGTKMTDNGNNKLCNCENLQKKIAELEAKIKTTNELEQIYLEKYISAKTVNEYLLVEIIKRSK